MKAISVETTTHGRVLIKDAATVSARTPLLVGFHGYKQNAEDMLEELDRVPGNDEWTIASVQGLHRFYSRGDERVVASWMTRQDRELAIADNIAYVDRVVDAILAHAPHGPIVFVGFSQGVAMAYRSAVIGAHRVQGLIAVGGDVPPDVKTHPAERFPEVLIAAGDSDYWYTPPKVDGDSAFLASIGVRAEVYRYKGGHEWTGELRDRIHRALEQFKR